MKILAIRTHWHPVNTPGSRRFESFLNFLAKENDVTLLSYEHPNHKFNIKEVSEKSYSNITVEIPKIFYNSLYQRFVGKLRMSIPQLDGLFSFGERILNQGVELCKKNKYDVIITTYQPITSLTVAHELSARTGVPWICDLRDLPNQFLPLGHFNKEAKYLNNIIVNSSGITCATDGLENRLVNEYQKKNVKTIYNGIPESWLKEIQDSSGNKHNINFEIIYAGSLYAGRSLNILLEAIEQLALPSSSKKLIKVRVFGNIKASVIKTYTDKFNNMVIFEGLVEQKDLKELYQKSSLLVNLMPEGHSAAIPSKIFEYAATGVKMLNISPESSFVSKFIDNNELGLTTNDTSECSEWLLTLFKSWEENENKILNCNVPGELRLFTREMQALTFQRYIEDILKNE